MDLPERLYAWRTHNGLTLQVVSNRSGVSVNVLTKAECGRRDVPFMTLRAIVERGLRMTLIEFLGPVPKIKRTVWRGRPRAPSSVAVAK